MGRHADIGPPAESLYGKKRKGTSSAQNVTTKGKETLDVKSSSDSDSTEDEQEKNLVSRYREKKTEGVIDTIARAVGIKSMAPKQRVS